MLNQFDIYNLFNKYKGNEKMRRALTACFIQEENDDFTAAVSYDNEFKLHIGKNFNKFDEKIQFAILNHEVMHLLRGDVLGNRNVFSENMSHTIRNIVSDDIINKSFYKINDTIFDSLMSIGAVFITRSKTKKDIVDFTEIELYEIINNAIESAKNKKEKIAKTGLYFINMKGDKNNEFYINVDEGSSGESNSSTNKLSGDVIEVNNINDNNNESLSKIDLEKLKNDLEKLNKFANGEMNNTQSLGSISCDGDYKVEIYDINDTELFNLENFKNNFGNAINYSQNEEGWAYINYFNEDGIGEYYENKPILNILLDVSGSMMYGKVLNEAFSYIANLDLTINLIEVDSEVKDVERIESSDLLYKEIKVIGGGGTDFQSAFKKIENLDGVETLIFTDGIISDEDVKDEFRYFVFGNNENNVNRKLLKHNNYNFFKTLK